MINTIPKNGTKQIQKKLSMFIEIYINLGQIQVK